MYFSKDGWSTNLILDLYTGSTGAQDPFFKANGVTCFFPLAIDSQVLVTILEKQTSTFQRVTFLLRPFIINGMLNNICFRAVHIPTKHNTIADSISRFLKIL